MFKYLILLIFSISLNANNITIASYNVENFFDLKKDNSEYSEFIPNTKNQWNQRNFNIKLNNLFKKYPEAVQGLKFGYICPGAMKTVNYLNNALNLKSSTKDQREVTRKIRILTDFQFFVEIYQFLISY